MPGMVNIPTPQFLHQLGGITDSLGRISKLETPESSLRRGAKPSPEYLVPVGLVPTADGLSWTTLDNTLPMSAVKDDLSNIVFIPAKRWQDTIEKKRHPSTMSNSPSVTSFSSSSGSGSSGFLTDVSFQWKSSSSAQRSRDGNNNSSRAKAAAFNSNSIPRKPGKHRTPRFYIDKEDGMEHEDFGDLTFAEPFSEEVNLKSDEWSLSSEEEIKQKARTAINGASRKQKLRNKRPVSEKKYAVLPGINGRSELSDFDDSTIVRFKDVHENLTSRNLPRLHKRTRKIPEFNDDDILDFLPVVSQNNDFNKNCVLPPLESIPEERFSSLSGRLSSRSNITVISEKNLPSWKLSPVRETVASPSSDLPFIGSVKEESRSPDRLSNKSVEVS